MIKETASKSAVLPLRLPPLLSVAVVIVSCWQHTSFAEAEPDFVLRGVFSSDTGLYFSLESKASGHKDWISANRPFEGLVLTDYDRAHATAHGKLNGADFAIQLVESEPGKEALIFKPSEVATMGQREKEALVEQYKLAAYKDLPAENHPLHIPMKQAADNQISTFRDSLFSSTATSVADTTNEDDSLSATKDRIYRPRIRNRINSRIWASDHIAIHGLPDIETSVLP